MALRTKTQRTLLMGFVASIACCGAVGIYCLAVGQFGWIQGQIILTTLTVAACSILGLAAAVPWERHRWHPIGPLGGLAVGVVLLMTMGLIWIQGLDSETYAKSVAIVWVIAVALPHMGLLAMARLRDQWRWVVLATVILIILLAGMLCLIISFEIGDEMVARLTGILSIGVACGSISTPILHRISAMRQREAVQTVELSLAITCPRCGRQQTLPAGRSTCAGCKLRFLIEIEEDNCRTCGYPLYKLNSAVCPECGTPILSPSIPEGASS